MIHTIYILYKVIMFKSAVPCILNLLSRGPLPSSAGSQESCTSMITLLMQLSGGAGESPFHSRNRFRITEHFSARQVNCSGRERKGLKG